MLIDWFTVAAQIVNFLILVYLLKRFLYRPLVRHMDEREQRIAERLRQAQDQQAEAQRRIDAFRRRQEELEEQRGEQLRAAEEEARRRRDELLEQARVRVESKRRSWLESLAREQEDFARGLKQESSRQILRFVQRALQDLADEPLNQRLAEVLLGRLKHLDPDLGRRLAQAAGEHEITVRSTCELDAHMKGRLTTALRQLCDRDAAVAYRVDAGQPLGIEAGAGSVRLSWGIAGYLDELETRVLTLFEEQGRKQQEQRDAEQEPGDDGAAEPREGE